MVTIFSFLIGRSLKSLLLLSCASYFHLFQDAGISITFLKSSEEIGPSRNQNLKALLLMSERFQKYETFLQALTPLVSFLHV